MSNEGGQLSEELGRAVARDPAIRDLVAQATEGVPSVTASPEGVDGQYVPTPDEWIQGVRDALQDRAELMEVHAFAVAELLGGGKGV